MLDWWEGPQGPKKLYSSGWMLCLCSWTAGMHAS